MQKKEKENVYISDKKEDMRVMGRTKEYIEREKMLLRGSRESVTLLIKLRNNFKDKIKTI